MSELAEQARKINEALGNRRKEWVVELRNLDDQVEQAQKEMNADGAKNDRSENAEYQIAADSFARLQVSRKQIQEKIDAYDSFKSMEIKTGNTATIKLGTTVKLRLIAINKKSVDLPNNIFYVKLVPAALGIARAGAVSSVSAVGRALEGLSVGSVFNAQTRKGTVTYKVEDIY